MPTIAEKLKEFLDFPSNTLCGPGGEFLARDFNLYNQVLSGELDNFVIFDNAGGKPFTIWHSNKKAIEALVKSAKSYVCCYKINGKETILKDLPQY